MRSAVGRYTETYRYLSLDIEKAFDTVSRKKLIDTLDINHLAGDDELRIIQYLMSNTTLRTKIMSDIGIGH